jgi:hypothetical protein
MLYERGVDTAEFALTKATLEGGVYFLPMSQERLNSLDKRPPMYEIPFSPVRYTSEADSYMVQAAIIDQINQSKDDDLWKALQHTEWELVG